VVRIAYGWILLGFDHDPSIIGGAFECFQERRKVQSAFFVSRHRENTCPHAIHEGQALFANLPHDGWPNILGVKMADTVDMSAEHRPWIRTVRAEEAMSRIEQKPRRGPRGGHKGVDVLGRLDNCPHVMMIDQCDTLRCGEGCQFFDPGAEFLHLVYRKPGALG
jgi:hypothetical protein